MILEGQKMKATLMTDYSSNAKNLGNEKEMTFTFNAIVRIGKSLKNVLTIRTYMGRSSSASVVYASIWAFGKKSQSWSGHGKAGGYGYHKPSAAIGEAITSAGITLDKRIDGVGDSAIREAIEAIVRAMGYKGEILIVEN
jgi:hypothetical protein